MTVPSLTSIRCTTLQLSTKYVCMWPCAQYLNTFNQSIYPQRPLNHLDSQSAYGPFASRFRQPIIVYATSRYPYLLTSNLFTWSNVQEDPYTKAGNTPTRPSDTKCQLTSDGVCPHLPHPESLFPETPGAMQKIHHDPYIPLPRNFMLSPFDGLSYSVSYPLVSNMYLATVSKISYTGGFLHLTW